MISQQAAILALYSTEGLTFTTVAKCVYCVVGTEHILFNVGEVTKVRTTAHSHPVARSSRPCTKPHFTTKQLTFTRR